jgi:nitrite reductase (NO-forming)
MNKAIIAGLAAGVLVVGLIFSPLFNPLSAAQAANETGAKRHVTLIASEKVVQVAPDNDLHPGGIMYNAMVFNGTIPGPVVAVNQGDTLEITLKNEGKVIHSLDFHAGIGPSNALSGNVAPGEEKTWTLHANTAGAFLYHCGADGLNGVWEHIANGMYGGIVVHPTKEKPAKEFYVVFGEIYNNADKGVLVGAGNETGSFDIGKFLNTNPDLVLTNGMAHKYVPSIGQQVKINLNQNATVFKVKPGEPTRWYIVNAGPNDGVAFHFISGMIDVRDGSVRGWTGKQFTQDETWWVPPGSASVIEAVFPEEGIYVGVDHNMADVVKGAAFAVLATNDATADDQPPEAWVPSKAWLNEHSASTTGGATGTVETGSTGGNATSTGPAGNSTSTSTTGGNATSTSGNATSTTGNATSTTGGNSTSTSNSTASG